MPTKALWTLAALVLTTATAHAYDQYSATQNTPTNCRACHGDFRAGTYTSKVDGTNWGNLHNLHRNTMLAGDCNVCHTGDNSTRFPVFINSSNGGSGGLPAIACVGCHGRAEDDNSSNPDWGSKGGYGAGLRRHHWLAGETVCGNCHQDADPANAYTPVGEDVLPPYYGMSLVDHASMPLDSCNGDGSENFAGMAIGLDNDGDDVWDLADTDCTPPIPDAGVPDAAVPDASIPDAAPVDAAPGSPDAATPDASAGGPDAAAGPDAGNGGGGSGGCGCNAPAGHGPGPLSLLALLLVGRSVAVRRTGRPRRPGRRPRRGAPPAP